MAHRVLHVVGNLGPYGVQRSMLTVCKAVGAPYEHVILGLSGGALEAVLEAEPFRTIVPGLPVPKHGVDPPTQALRALTAVARVARQVQPSIIHTHTYTPALAAILLGRLSGRRVVTHIRGHWRMHRARWLHRAVWRACATDHLRVIACSRAVGEAFHETTGVAYTFIPNAVDHESLKRDALRTLNVHTELDLPPEAYLVLTVGRIDDQKNYPCVLRCARQLVSWDPTIHLICVGDGLRFGQMLQLRDTMGLRGNVHFLGRRDDVPALMARAHAFLLLSRNEGMPRVVAEAMLSGLPVVATAVDGTPEMMDDGMEGFLVPDDDDQLAAQRVMQIRKDPVLASAMAAAGRIRAERNHTLGPLGAAVSSVYDDLLTT